MEPTLDGDFPYFSLTLPPDYLNLDVPMEDDNVRETTLPTSPPREHLQQVEFSVTYIYCANCVRNMLNNPPPPPEKMDNGMNRIYQCMCDKCKEPNGL